MYLVCTSFQSGGAGGAGGAGGDGGAGCRPVTASLQSLISSRSPFDATCDGICGAACGAVGAGGATCQRPMLKNGPVCASNWNMRLCSPSMPCMLPLWQPSRCSLVPWLRLGSIRSNSSVSRTGKAGCLELLRPYPLRAPPYILACMDGSSCVGLVVA